MASKRERLKKLWEKAKKDKNLPLKSGATKLVFGAGNPEAKILFIGEGPGYWEDQKGIPFVGNAGALLNQALQLIKLERKDVFITNVIMHRPPGNRDPLPSEIAAYALYLDGIIKILRPKVIVTLGRFSMAKFLSGVYISSVHGRPREVSWQDQKILIMPMYHPAAALRNGQVKEKFIQDFRSLGELLIQLEESSKNKEDKEGSKQMNLI